MTTFRDTAIARMIGTDYKYVDGLETLSLYRPATTTTYTGIKATSANTIDSETGGELALQEAGKVWHLHAATVPVEPLPADELTDSNGVVWIVGPNRRASRRLYDAPLYNAATIGGQPLYYEVTCLMKVT